MVAMLSVSLSSCKSDDGIDEGATIVGQWIHEDGVGEADVLTFTGSLTQGEAVYTEFDLDDYPETMTSTYTFNPQTGVLKVPGFTYFDVQVKTLTTKKLTLYGFPDDDESTTFKRKL